LLRNNILLTVVGTSNRHHFEPFISKKQQRMEIIVAICVVWLFATDGQFSNLVDTKFLNLFVILVNKLNNYDLQFLFIKTLIFKKQL